MNEVDFAILSGLEQWFGNPRHADIILMTDVMQHLIYTTLAVIYIILCYITYSDFSKSLLDTNRTFWKYNTEI